MNADFSTINILVIGDVMLDEYLIGTMDRISPEAPVPIVNVKRTEMRLGGAANVAHNIASLGAKVTLIGQAGDDETRKQLQTALDEAGVTYSLITTNAPTIKKTRLVAHNQQVVRIDHEEPQPLVAVEQVLAEAENGYDAIIVSDYNKGVVTEELMQGLIARSEPVIGDLKPANAPYFTGCYAITPNVKEGRAITGETEPESIGKALVKMLDCHVILTRGAEGESVFDKNTGTHIHQPTNAQEVYDVSGAGDTFTAAFTLGIASSMSLEEAAQLANAAAGIVVGKFGTATVKPEELRKHNLHKL